MHFSYKPAFFLIFIKAFIILTPLAYAQNSKIDSCNSLNFHSEIEKRGFQSLCAGQKPDYLEMAIAVNPMAGIEQLKEIRLSIDNEVDILKILTSKIKNPRAKLKLIFFDVQKKFLKQYYLDAKFTDIFESGKFNCLTATLLYSTLLDDLSVKYTIKFMPGHVYLIAYADQIPYLFETTDPVTGFVELNSTVQTKVMQDLRLMRYITSDNGENDDSGDLFDRYYIKLNNTEIRGLVGYLYINSAINMLLKKHLLSSYYLISKGMILTPMDELAIMQEDILKQAIIQAKNTSVLKAELLVKYYYLTTNENKKNQLADEFEKSIYSCLFSSFPSPDSILPIYLALSNGIGDEDVKKVLAEIYTDGYALYLNKKGSPEELLDFLSQAYSMGNKSNSVKNRIQSAINTITDPYEYNKKGLSSYDSLLTMYPFLLEFDSFRTNRCNILLRCAEQSFQNKNAKEGLKLLEKFETGNYYLKSSSYSCNPSYLYGLAGTYYSRIGNISKAKSMLNKGLSYDPDNEELKNKLKVLK